ncbi:MAG: MBL fold metallo-hydrolase [Peptococcales bacterium]|jgi:phosphoribosyl 1,2-cyclic phosphodiesterase
MQLTVLSSGSHANAYLLKAKGSALLLDAGLPIATISRAVLFEDIQACLVTHEHQDHSRSAADIARRGVTVITSPGTASVLKLMHPFVHTIKAGQTMELRDWDIMAFDTRHDATDPIGFLLRYRPTQETIVYATDTYYLRYRFPGTHYWIVECNYIDDVLYRQIEEGTLPEPLAVRLKKSHMSLNRLMEALKANDLSETRKIVLVHLSDSRSDERKMIEAIEQATGKPTVAASDGEIIDLELTPF